MHKCDVCISACIYLFYGNINQSDVLPGILLEKFFLAKRSLRASPTVSVDLKFTVELNSFSDASRVSQPAIESLLLVTFSFRKESQSIVLRSTSCGFYLILIAKWRRRRAEWLRKTMDCLLTNESSSVFLQNLHVTMAAFTLHKLLKARKRSCRNPPY